MSQSITTVLQNIIDKYVPSTNNVVRPALTQHNDPLIVNNAQSNPSVITDDSKPLIRERFTKPLDVKVTSIPRQNDGGLQLTLQKGLVLHTAYLVYANIRCFTLANIVEEAIAGILKEGAKHPESCRQLEILVETLKAVQHHANHATDIYGIHSDIADACILIYTMDTFWYDSINSALRRLPVMTDEDFQTFAPFCYLMQTYLKKTPATKKNIPNIVYRGVQLTDEQIEQFKQTDNCFHFTSFSSTSTNRNIAEMYGNVLFLFNLNSINYRGKGIIRVGAYVASQSYFPTEDEFLIWPLSIFKLEKYEFDQENRKHLIYLKSCEHPNLEKLRANYSKRS